MPQIAAAQYDSGTYGSCNYSDECTSDTSSTPSSATTSQELAAPTSGAGILLNDYSEFSTAAGKQVTLEVGQKVYYKISTNGAQTQYSLFIESTADRYVVLVLADGSKQKILVGQSLQIDSDGDGRKDIVVKLVSISGKTAVLGFSSVIPQVIQTTAQAKKVNSTKSSIVLYALIAALGVTMFMLLLAKRRKRRVEENPS